MQVFCEFRQDTCIVSWGVVWGPVGGVITMPLSGHYFRVEESNDLCIEGGLPS